MGLGGSDPAQRRPRICAEAGQQRDADAGLHRLAQAGHRVEPEHDAIRVAVLGNEAQEPPVADRLGQRHPVRKARIAIRPVGRAVERPADVREPAPEQVVGRVVAGPDRHVGVPAGQVQRIVRHHHVEADARAMCAETGEDRHQQVGDEARRRGDPKLAGGFGRPPGDLAGELRRGLLHGTGRLDHRQPGLRRGVAGARALEQARAERRLDRRQPPERGRVVDAEPRGGGRQPALVGDGLHEPEVVPGRRHRLTLQSCKTVLADRGICARPGWYDLAASARRSPIPARPPGPANGNRR